MKAFGLALGANSETWLSSDLSVLKGKKSLAKKSEGWVKELASGKRSHNYEKIHVSWENSLFLWSCSMKNYQRV